MASVTKDSKGRSPYWIACYTDAAGKRLKKSTKTRSREVAMRTALQLERASRLAASGELTEHRCRQLISDLLEQITDGKESVRVKSVRLFLTGWLADKKALLSKGSLWSYDASIGAFLEHMGTRADRPLTVIRAEDLQGFVTALHRGGLAPKTVGTYAKVLRSALKAARIQQLITFNPAEGLDLPRGESVTRGTFTPAEVGMLAAAAPTTDWRTVILLGALTGQRLRDCANAEWKRVDLAAGTMMFKVSKTGRDLTVPLHPKLREHLEAIAGDAPQKYLAPDLANRSTGGAHGLSEAFKAIMKGAGVEGGVADNAGKRRMTARSFHSLRHGFVSGLANAGIGEDLRMRLAGHTTKAIHAGYTHHELQALAEAVGKLPTIT